MIGDAEGYHPHATWVLSRQRPMIDGDGLVMDVLRVEWSAITNATVASLVGSVDESATDALAGIRTLAKDLERVLVDLERVTHIDERGVVLLESLARIPNVGILNVPTRVEDEMRALGRFGF